MQATAGTTERLRRAAAWTALAALALPGIACGGAAVNTYASAVTRQEQCCEGLTDAAAREACRGGIRRVDNEAAANSEVNQATFACVDRYFRCDAATGRATRESAQAQLDCLNDLGTD